MATPTTKQQLKGDRRHKADLRYREVLRKEVTVADQLDYDLIFRNTKDGLVAEGADEARAAVAAQRAVEDLRSDAASMRNQLSFLERLTK